jgi:hypothetical protein
MTYKASAWELNVSGKIELFLNVVRILCFMATLLSFLHIAVCFIKCVQNAMLLLICLSAEIAGAKKLVDGYL